MNGPQHYAEAERLLDHPGLNTVDPQPSDALLIACAQVHATLAHTAALADSMGLPRSFYNDKDAPPKPPAVQLGNSVPACNDWQQAIHGGPDL